MVFNTRTTASNRNIPCKAPAGPSARSRFARWPALSFREVCPAHALSPWAVSLDPLHSSLASASAYAATKSSSCLFRTRPRTAGLCDTPGTAPPLQRTHRSHTLPPTGAPFGKRRMHLLSSSALHRTHRLHTLPPTGALFRKRCIVLLSSLIHVQCSRSTGWLFQARKFWISCPTCRQGVLSTRRKHVCPESSSFHAACFHTFTARLL